MGVFSCFNGFANFISTRVTNVRYTSSALLYALLHYASLVVMAVSPRLVSLLLLSFARSSLLREKYSLLELSTCRDAGDPAPAPASLGLAGRVVRLARSRPGHGRALPGC